MRIKSLLLLAALLLLCAPTIRAGFVPAEEEVQFGEIDEAKGDVTVRTYVINKGDEPLAIKRVRITCGCTGVKFDDRVVEPGDSAWLDITYNPRNRFGEFVKSVKVFDTAGGSVPVVFHGTVINTEETIALRYPYKAGPLRLSENKVLTGKLERGEQRSIFVNFFNMSDSQLSPSVSCDNPGVSVSLGPVPVPPRSVGSISIIPNCKEDLPPGSHQVELKLNPDPSDPQSQIETIEVFLQIE